MKNIKNFLLKTLVLSGALRLLSNKINYLSNIKSAFKCYKILKVLNLNPHEQYPTHTNF